MDVENNGKIEYEYKPMFDIKDIDLFISEEDLKFQDNTKPIKREPMNRNYNFLFSEEKSDKIHKLVRKYYSQLTTNGEGIKSIASYLRLIFIEKVKKFYMQEEDIWEVVHFLTSNIGIEKHEQILEHLRANSLVQEVKENHEIIGIKTIFGEIKFSEIGNFFPDLEVDEDIKNIKNRMGVIGEAKGDCHDKAVEYSKKLKDMGIENDVVTANRCITADKIKHLHSWNEFKINGQEHVLDYTQNVVMNKEGYYALNHINKIISKINCVDIEKDEKIYKQMDNRYSYMDIKTYLTCRDEIMRDLQKNIDVFDKER